MARDPAESRQIASWLYGFLREHPHVVHRLATATERSERWLHAASENELTLPAFMVPRIVTAIRTIDSPAAIRAFCALSGADDLGLDVREHVAPGAGGLSPHTLRLGAEVGELEGSVAAAAEDGVLTEPEARRISHELSDVERRIAELKARLFLVRAREGAK